MRTKAMAAALLASLLAACGSMGLQQPQGFNDRLGYALGVHLAVLDATMASLNAGDLSSAEAEHVAQAADGARGLLDAARSLQASGDPGAAERRLALASAILQQLQDYLRGGET